MQRWVLFVAALALRNSKNMRFRAIHRHCLCLRYFFHQLSRTSNARAGSDQSCPKRGCACLLLLANGSKPDRITFFTLTHTRKNGEPVDAGSAAIIDEFNTNLKFYEDRNEIITDEVRHIVYANVLGPERDNRVRGFGTGVVWSDVPGIITEKRGICREVEAIKASYEEQRKAANFEIEKLKMEASEREERQRIEAANVLAQLRKEYAESMVAHNRQVELEVENMKREMRVEIMSALKRAADRGMVEPNRIDVPQVCVNRIEQGNGMEIQASGEVEDDGIVVLQNNGTDDEIGYRPCMVNVTGFSK